MITKIIDINSAEYGDVLRIRTEVFIKEQGISPDLEIDEHEKEAIYFLTYFNGRPGATGRLRTYGKNIKFERIAALIEFRGKGVAQDLMRSMLSFAHLTYPDKIPYLHAQERSIGFYEKLGWRKTGLPFEEAGIPHQAMELSV